MSFVIKPYELSDIVWVVETASYRSIVEEANRPDLVNIRRWYEIAQLIDSHGIGFIVWKDEERVGMIGSLIFPNLFNPEIKTSTIVTWYVLPEYRKSRVSMMLFKAMEEESKLAADGMTFSLLSNNMIKERTLTKLGFELTESAFTKRFGELNGN